MSRTNTLANDLQAFRAHVKELRDQGAIRVFAKRGEHEYLCEFEADPEEEESPRVVGFAISEPAVGGGIHSPSDFEEDDEDE